MRHYEIVFLVHPDQSDQTQAVLNKFTSLVESSGGKVHRSEDIGSRRLAYPIQDQFKASYALLNVECNQEVLDEIKASFKFNDSIIRDLILTRKKEYSEISALSKQTEEDDERNKKNKSASTNKASSAEKAASDNSKKNKKEVLQETEDKNEEETK